MERIPFVFMNWQLNSVKVVMLPKVSIGSVQILPKFQLPFFRNGQTDLKIWICKKHRRAKVILKKKKLEDLHFPVFKI